MHLHFVHGWNEKESLWPSFQKVKSGEYTAHLKRIHLYEVNASSILMYHITFIK